MITRHVGMQSDVSYLSLVDGGRCAWVGLYAHKFNHIYH